MKKIFLILTLIFNTQSLSAHEGEDTLTDKNVVKHEVFEVKDSKAKIHVVIRNDGHTVAKPYVIEIRPDCKGDSDWTTLPVADVESACDVSVSSTKINKSGSQVILSIKGPNQKLYNSGNLKILKSDKPVCESVAKQHRFDIASLCQ